MTQGAIRETRRHLNLRHQMLPLGDKSEVRVNKGRVGGGSGWPFRSWASLSLSLQDQVMAEVMTFLFAHQDLCSLKGIGDLPRVFWRV